MERALTLESAPLAQHPSMGFFERRRVFAALFAAYQADNLASVSQLLAESARSFANFGSLLDKKTIPQVPKPLFWRSLQDVRYDWQEALLDAGAGRSQDESTILCVQLCALRATLRHQLRGLAIKAQAIGADPFAQRERQIDIHSSQPCDLLMAACWQGAPEIVSAILARESAADPGNWKALQNALAVADWPWAFRGPGHDACGGLLRVRLGLEARPDALDPSAEHGDAQILAPCEPLSETRLPEDEQPTLATLLAELRHTRAELAECRLEVAALREERASPASQRPVPAPPMATLGARRRA